MRQNRANLVGINGYANLGELQLPNYSAFSADGTKTRDNLLKIFALVKLM
jgi:hypothetical protein